MELFQASPPHKVLLPYRQFTSRCCIFWCGCQRGAPIAISHKTEEIKTFCSHLSCGGMPKSVKIKKSKDNGKLKVRRGRDLYTLVITDNKEEKLKPSVPCPPGLAVKDLK